MALSPVRLLAGFICVLCVLRVAFHDSGPLTVASIIGVAALQLPISLPGRRPAFLLPLQAVLNYLPLLAEADGWRTGGTGFVAASVLLVVRGPWAWPIFGLIAVVEGVLAGAVLDLAPVYVYYAVVAPLNVGLTLYGLSRLADLLDRVRRERSELAARAGEVERLRLWRHVHDLVVSSASTVERLTLDLVVSSASTVERLTRHRDDVRTAMNRAVAVAREALAQVRSLPAVEAALPVPPRDDDTRILRLATPILVVTHVLFAGQSVFNFVADEGVDPGSGQVAYLALLPVTFGLQFWHLAALRTRPRFLTWTLIAQAVTIYVPLLQGEVAGLVVSGFFAGVVLLHVRARFSWPLCVAICGVSAVEAWPGWYEFCASLAAALTVYGLTRLVALVTELRETRAELVEVAALRERLKVGRDVHDLLGRGLTAIVLHGELTLRLLDTDPGRAMGQLDRVAEAARATLSDTALVSGRLSLADELASARAMLESAGATVRINAAPVTGPAEPVLAVVLREAVTNVIRHSTPVECLVEITVEDGRARLRVTNDGASPAPGPAPGPASALASASDSRSGEPGTGLRNLRARLAAVGGELTTIRNGDRFELLAHAPVDHENLMPTR